MEPISDFDQKRKAESIVNRLALQDELGNTKNKIAMLFKDAPIAVADSASQEELEELMTAIKAGTATNNKIARFLELANQLGIG